MPAGSLTSSGSDVCWCRQERVSAARSDFSVHRSDMKVVRSLYQRLSTFDTRAVNALLTSMSDEAHAVVDQGRLGAELTEKRIAFMRALRRAGA